jgi:isoquinoline 1-oxidoreductase beta subunit
MPVAWTTRLTGNSIMQFVNPANIKDGVDLHFLAGLYDGTYAVPNFQLDYAMRNTHVPPGFWRGVNSNQNAYYRECFVDEMAAAAGQDPYRYRRKMLQHEKARRDLAVLDAAAKKAEWEKPLAAGLHRGIAVYASYGSWAAAVAEIAMEGGEVRIKRIVIALDSGHVASPDAMVAQVEGSVVWALSATLFGEITIKEGRVAQSNFHDYPMLKLDRMPVVETALVPSGGFWGGAGEPAVPPVAPALVNAIFAATGKRIRSLPLVKHGLVKV